MKLIPAALVLSVVCATLCAQPTLVDIPFEKFVLSNGLTVIVHEDHKAPIVAVNIWYHVGSKNEKFGKTGFAHLYEHLMFGGSENNKGSYIQGMEKIGATDLNGTTNQDRTNYFENVPTPALDYVLFAESDRMGHFINSFDKKTLDQQRGVVQNEKRQGENQPYGTVDTVILQNTYPANHPYSWNVIGSMEDLNAASLEDVKEWFRANYGPANTVLVLAGDIDVKTAREKVTKYFGDIPSGPPVAHQEQWVAKMTGTHRMKMLDRVPQARIFKVWNIPGAGTEAGDYLDLVSDVLARGRNSRLYKRLVYDEQLATEVSASLDPREIAGQFGIDATARPGVDLAKIEKVIDEELARFLKDGPTPQELQRVQTQYTADFIRGLDRVGGFGGKSDILAQSEVFTGDPSHAFRTSLKRHQEATTAQLQKAAVDWLSDGVFVLEVIPFPAYTAQPSTMTRTTPPPIGPAPQLKLPTLQRTTLSNGLKVVLAERHEIPVVNVWLKTDAGFAADQSSVSGAASMTSAMLTYGTKTRSALQISEQVDSLGTQLRAMSNLDLSTVSLSTLKRNLDASLDVFADVILNPSFPAADFSRLQKQRLAAIEQEKANPIQAAQRVFGALLFGPGHAYGVPLTGSGDEASVAKMTPADLVKFHDAWYRPNNSTIIVVGDTTLAEITPKLERAFGGWKRGTVPAKNIATVSPMAKSSVYLIDKPGAQQSVIVTGLVAPPKSQPGDIALETMNVVLGGNFSGRLNMNIREDKHYSYGAGSVLIAARAQRPFILYAPVQTDKTKESLVEVNKEIHEIVSARPVAAPELEAAKASQTLELPGSRETMTQVGNSISNLIQYNLPDNYYDTFASKVSALKTSDIDDAAKSVLHPDQMVWVIVGDRSKIEKGLRELNLGEVHLIDTNGKPVSE